MRKPILNLNLQRKLPFCAGGLLFHQLLTHILLVLGKSDTWIRLDGHWTPSPPSSAHSQDSQRSENTAVQTLDHLNHGYPAGCLLVTYVLLRGFVTPSAIMAVVSIHVIDILPPYTLCTRARQTNQYRWKNASLSCRHRFGHESGASLYRLERQQH